MILFLFCKDLLNYTSQFLSYIDLFALLHACPRLYPLIDKKYLDPQQVIRREFLKFGLEYENLVTRMTPNSLLYGGIMLGILTSDIRKESDLDLLHFEKNNKIYSPVEELTIKCGKYNTLEKTFVWNINQYAGCWILSYELCLVKVDGTSSDNRMYQNNTILHKTESLANYLDYSCDLDITKIYYYQNRLHIKNIKAIFEKRFDLNVNHHLKREFAKYNSAVAKEEIFDLGEWAYQTFWNYILERLLERIQKYKKRGYRPQDEKFEKWTSVSKIEEEITKNTNLINYTRKNNNHLFQFLRTKDILEKKEIARRNDLNYDDIKQYNLPNYDWKNVLL